MLRGVLEAQAPPKFTASETINTLSNRLANATLLEDRRGAILGLRSFAKEYPASVASGALRHLITTLTNGVDDVDTVKVVLETLLMLFNPNEDSPEASSDIALWLADEFTTRQDNITILLDLLDHSDFYSRLYALQLMAAISLPRPERTQECILAAPLGITRLVSTLDDSREAIRSAGILLLNEITQGSPELQKVVAFDGAFEKIFNLIKAEGSLAEGGIVVQDCLTLLANLLSLNASNQSQFRETGFVARLAQLIAEDAKASEDNDEDGPSDMKDKNVWGLLAILRMFLIPGNLGTQANQAAFEKNGILQQVLDLAFSAAVGPPIRAEALKTCADIIRGNSKIQERFAHNKIARISGKDANGVGHEQANGDSKAYIIDALLDTTLSVSSVTLFDVRLAASQCIQAYFYNHTPIRQHFLHRAIEGHTSGEDETSNIITILIQGPRSFQTPDPYRLWFAAELVHQLLFESSEAKNMTMAITEGDAANGEEVVTCIQTITGNLTAAISTTGEDERVCVGYLMVLCTWLFEDADAVNDLLSEGSVIQSLIQATSKNEKSRELVQGLCAVLLGILYEFSTKDSPIARRTLQPLLLKGLGRELYVSKITRLREHPFVRDFEVLPQALASAEPGMLPDVFFDQTFVNLLKDNYTRLIRAIDKDPGIENARLHEEGIDRDLVDSLQSQIKDKNESLQKSESDILNLEGKLGQEQADHRRSQERFNTELTRIKNINEALQKEHETESENKEAEHRGTIRGLQDQHQRNVQDLESKIERTRKDAERIAETVGEQHQNELKSLQKHIQELEQMAKQSNETIEMLQRTNNTVSETVKQRDSQVESMKQSKQILEEKIEFTSINTRKLEGQIKELEARLKEAGKHETELQVELNKKEEARQSVQTELDDLLIVLGDLEEKRANDKKKLKELGAEVSDADEDDEEEEEEEEGGGEEEGEEDEADTTTIVRSDARKSSHVRDASVD